MAANKKASRYLAVALLSVLGLTACNEVVAKPSDYDREIITAGVTSDMESNLMSIVYDALREGSLASDVLNEVLYQYSVSMLGRYNKLVGPSDSASALSTGTTLKQAVASAKSADKSVANAFIKVHHAYWTVNANNERVDDNGNVVTGAGDVASASELETLIAKWNTIENRIKEKMYNEIKNGAFSYRSKFSERTYLVSLRSSLEKVADYNVLNPTDSAATTGYFTPRVFDAKYDYEDVFVEYLHRENYQQNFALADDEANNTVSYVEDAYVKDIYRELLTEQYLLDETYNTLGRSYARKVNIISLATKSDSDKSAQYLMNYFVNNVVYAAPTTAGLPATSITDAAGNPVSDNRISEDELIALSDAYKGILNADLSPLAESYLENSNAFDAVMTGPEVDYYVGTDFGDLMEEYSKIKANPLTTDTTIEKDFTGNGAYTKEVGLELKTRSLASNSYVTKGWFIKNGGLTDFTTFRDRLFNIGVASALDSIKPEVGVTVDYDQYDRFYLEGGVWKIDTARDFNKYVARVNGSYFLKSATSESVSSKDDIIFYNSDSKVYYLVEIVEAVSSSKFNKSADAWNYAKLRNDRKVMADYVNEVAKILASNDSYKTLAKKHWLEEMGISYHDDVVYDYFKTNFPELFD
ncbi:MAG TPA: hypothetical protein PKO28_02015 [Bacilli bacterium]|nr:hypothetical protein [Bacilli bacterium]HPS18577.1 hypothetical protein [Bacilli bacterium]